MSAQWSYRFNVSSYMLNTPKEKKSLCTELTLAAVGSLLTGFGAVFLFNLTGNYL